MIRGGEVNINDLHQRHGGTLLHVAAAMADDTIVSSDQGEATVREATISFLLSQDAQVNARALNGSTPLHWAAGAGHEDAIHRLLLAGADPESTTHTWTNNVFSLGSGQTPLHWASQSGFDECVQLLLHAAPLSAVTKDEKGQTPSDLAEKALQFSTAQTILSGESDWLLLELTHEQQVSKRFAHEDLMQKGPSEETPRGSTGEIGSGTFSAS
uniref:Uncharacterized protein n=1 Tax=Rhizochromulina marina TaxID=1034831 RepID=A0A7S2RJJ8_9STRA|mmetsp:Transcript_1728/g.5095  ORF Transcript_1728/g.5095 Transcript_1728/m.5095 type:complete len:213 (+) Transcript_1728:3-641(+)